MTKESTKAEAPDRGRFSANRETEAILRLLRGEDLEALPRELGVTATTLSAWRDAFLDGGKAALKSRPADERDGAVARLRAEVGQLTMDVELLDRKCQHREAGRPFASRRRSGADSPPRLPRHRPALRPPASLPGLRPGPLDGLLPQGP